MKHRPASDAQPETWPACDDEEDSAPFEPWALDEVDSDFAAPPAHLQAHHDAAFE
ncbi:MAG: hypothetical protein IT503_04775 [Burkholderiaceae bacterium]|nr:hypothetical protein [Ideonella sp.]MCC7285474.1 hypothetical protein [Burkholderiaceae bacterium]